MTDKDSPLDHQEPVSIYRYFNYRKFLRDLYRYRKSIDKNFSYRYFARKAGINSSAIYLLLVQERQNMTSNLLPKFARGLNLDSREAKYLECMVNFTHAKTAKAKQAYFDQMSSLLPESARLLTAREKEYYSKWYNVAIRESLAVMPMGNDYKTIAKFLSPPIKAVEARKALTLLEDLKLIRKDEKGFWKATDQALRSTPELGPLWIHAFQREMMDLAKDSLERYSREERHVASSTFSVSREGFERINAKAAQFLSDIEHIVESDANESRVYQLNVQLFPLSRRREEENSK